MTSTRATVPSDLSYWVYRTNVWWPVANATSALTLSAADTSYVLLNGLRIGPQTQGNNRFTTDYVEFTTRYIVTN